MRTISIAELKELRKQYNPDSDQEKYEKHINSLSNRDAQWKLDRIVKNRDAFKKIKADLEKFDKVIAYIDKHNFLTPDSHGGDFDKTTLWNGALYLVKDSPENYQISVPQYGRENAIVSFRG